MVWCAIIRIRCYLMEAGMVSATYFGLAAGMFQLAGYIAYYLLVIRKEGKEAEPLTGYDPQISEWGNPPVSDGWYPDAEFIGVRERTRGSETSQYPEEKKTRQ